MVFEVLVRLFSALFSKGGLWAMSSFVFASFLSVNSQSYFHFMFTVNEYLKTVGRMILGI